MKPSIRMAILARDHFRCRYCGRNAPEVVLEVDHVIPRALGGTHEVTNLITACRDCNGGKSDTPYAPPDMVYSEKAARAAFRVAGDFITRTPWPNHVVIEHRLRQEMPGLIEVMDRHSLKVHMENGEVHTWIMGLPR